MLKKIGRDVSIYGSGDLAFRLIGFLIFPVYAHVFSVAEFGIYALVGTITSIVGIFANLGIYNGTQRYYWDPQTDTSTQPAIVSTGLGALIVWSCGIVLCLVAVLYPAREIIASRYGISWAIMVIALITIIPEQVLQYCLDVLRLYFTPWKYAFISFLKNIFGVVVGLILILLFDSGLKGLFLGALVGALAAVPIALILIRRDLALVFDPEIARRLVAFGYPFIFAGVAFWVFGSIDRWMLAELSNATQLGLYAIAYKVTVVVLFLNGAFGQAWSPIALKLKGEDSQYRLTYARIFSVWFFFLTIVGSTVALFGKEVLSILTPPEYWAASPILGLLVMGVVLSGTTQITGIGISLENKTRLFAFATWATALANGCLNFLLIPSWGAEGAAIATFLSYGLLTALYLFWSQKLHPIPLEKPKLLYSGALAVGIGATSIGLAELDFSVQLVMAKVALLVLMVLGGVFLGIVDIAMVKGLVWRKSQVETDTMQQKHAGRLKYP